MIKKAIPIQHHIGINWPHINAVLPALELLLGFLACVILCLGTVVLVERYKDLRRAKTYGNVPETMREFCGNSWIFSLVVVTIVLWITILSTLVFEVLKFFFWV